MKKYHFTSIAEQNQTLGLPAPEHPQLCVLKINSDQVNSTMSCDNAMAFSTEFYSISLKHIISGDFFYGRTKYDYQNGAMIFTAPHQEMANRGLKVKSDARTIIFHQDYVAGHPIHEQIKKSSFFNYDINEALHLSPREEQQIKGLFDAIDVEYHNNQDEFTKELILDLMTTLLRYASRYYHRQFLTRKESQNSLYVRFKQRLQAALADGDSAPIPTVEELASQLHVTARYLSDALKVETGKTAKEWIHLELIDTAKSLLLASDASVSEVAYQLGFEYPNYFARLFKKKVGVTPTQFRNNVH